MTICIGTLCAKRKIAIFASDRMLTNPVLSVEFEHDEPKYQGLSKTCVALTAGEALAPTELCEEVTSEVKKKASPKIYDITKIMCDKYRECKMRRVEEIYFRPRDLSIEEYMRVQKHLNENVVLRLERAIESEEMRMSVIVVGVDNTGAHLFLVTDPGQSTCLDRIGFHAIGSGLPHAISTFIAFNYTPNIDLKTATYITYEAKKSAEKAPGVGKTATDMGIISSKEIRVIKPEEINKLEEIYQEKTRLERASIAEIDEMISSLPLGE